MLISFALRLVHESLTIRQVAGEVEPAATGERRPERGVGELVTVLGDLGASGEVHAIVGGD